MMDRLAVLAVVSAFVPVEAGCRISPPARFYTLRALAAPVAPSSSLSLSVGPVSVPDVVDRPEIVVSTGAHELRLDELNRWASPLQDNLSRVVAENLVALLRTPRVMLFPQALSAEPQYRVAIEVLSFESSLRQSITLDAVWTVRRGSDGKSETGRTSAREKVADGNYDAVVAAHSRAVLRLSQDIADAVRALERAPR